MIEKRRVVEGYEKKYEITSTGRIYTHKSKRFLERCGYEYGFHIVSLWDHNGKRKNWNVFKLWKHTYPELPKEQFKGALKIKYDKACEISQNPDIHF